MSPRFALACLLAVAAAAGPTMPAARAAESYDSCRGTITSLPTTITTQGTWCLKGDLATALDSGVIITVATSNVTIDCNGFKIGNLAAGEDTQTTGIHADGWLVDREEGAECVLDLRVPPVGQGRQASGPATGAHAIAPPGHRPVDALAEDPEPGG